MPPISPVKKRPIKKAAIAIKITRKIIDIAAGLIQMTFMIQM
jgi:hypothetical protein